VGGVVDQEPDIDLMDLQILVPELPVSILKAFKANINNRRKLERDVDRAVDYLINNVFKDN